MELKKSVMCGICPGTCVVDVLLENGKLFDISAAKDEPFGALCLRGKFAKDMLYSADRLKKPLIRTGEKCTGAYREASWEEALDFAAAGFLKVKEKYGQEALISHSGRGTFDQATSEYLMKTGFFEPLGSPNISNVGSICANSFFVMAPVTTFGPLGSITPDIAHADRIIVWGANPITKAPQFQFHAIQAAIRRGAKVTAIDHFQTDICKRAENYHLVRSGTDGALALGIMKVIIEENLYDKDFVKNWTQGFDELKEYVNTKTLEEWAAIPGLEPEAVRSLAHQIHEEEKTTLVSYTGLEYSNSGVQTIRAVYTIWALLGKIDKLGCLLLSPEPKVEKANNKAEKANRTGNTNKAEYKIPGKKPIGAAEYPLFYELIKHAQFMEFPKAVLEDDPYPVRGLLNIGSSILTSYPNAKKYAQALSKLDFLVVVDRFFTADCQYADVVLPSTTHFEDESYVFHGPNIRKRERVVEPVGEARADLFILHDLAERLGYGEHYPKDETELLEMGLGSKELAEQLNRDGFIKRTPPESKFKKYEDGSLRKDAQPGFPTPSGKFEFKSAILEKFGYPGLPEYTEPTESPVSQPELARDYPLSLNTGTRIMTTFRSQYLNIAGLLKIQPDPLVTLNTEDARKRGIADKDRVWVKTKRDKVEFTAKVTDEIPEGEVDLNMGGGSPYQSESWANSNANYLTDDQNRDYISGFPIYKALLCDVEKSGS